MTQDHHKSDYPNYYLSPCHSSTRPWRDIVSMSDHRVVPDMVKPLMPTPIDRKINAEVPSLMMTRKKRHTASIPKPENIQ